MDKKKYILIGIGILLVLVLGGTYAWFNYIASQDDNGTVVTSGTLSIRYEDGTIIGADNLMPDYEPNYDDTCNDGLCYRNDFTVTNTGTLDVLINGILELDTNTFESDKLMYKIMDGETLIMEAAPISNTENTSLLTNMRLDVPTGSKTLTLFIWLDETATNESLGKSYTGTIKINGTQVGIPENINFSGYVLDSNNRVVPYATVLVESDPKTTTTDENGYYEIQNIPLGNHTLTITKNEEELIKSPVTIQYGQEYKVASKIIVTNSENTRFDIKVSNIEESLVAISKEEKEETKYIPIVTYDCKINNGKCADIKEEVKSGSNVNLTLKPTKTNYTFVGWNTNPNAHEGLESFIMPETNTTLYAIFKKEVVVEFEKGNASSISETEKRCYIYNNETECEVTAPTYETATNNDKDGFIKIEGEEKVPERGTIVVSNNTAFRANVTSPVSIPTSEVCLDITYNGAAQTIVTSSAYTLENNVKTNAGTYLITASLNGNYIWTDTTNTPKTFECVIKRRNITYKADSDTKDYDNTPLTKQSASLTSGEIVTGHNATFDITGSVTNVGTETNTLNSVTIKDASLNDVTNNYNITKENGTLAITPATFTNQNISISGTAILGNTLTVTPTTSPEGNYSYSWWTSNSADAVNGDIVPNANTNTYKITENEVGKYIGVTVTVEKENYQILTLTKTTNIIGDFNCNISGAPENWTTNATLTGTISNGVQGYSWTNTSEIPTNWTTSTNTIQTIEIDENNMYYLHIKGDNDNTKYCNINVTKIDNENPVITNLILESNDKAITATIEGHDNEKSGITKYYFSLDGEVYTESENNNYTFTDLTYGETYTVYTYVKDALNNESIVSNDEITIPVPCPEDAPINENGYCEKQATPNYSCDDGTLNGTACSKTATSGKTCTGVGGSLSGSNCYKSATPTTSTTYKLTQCSCEFFDNRVLDYGNCATNKTYGSTSACFAAAEEKCDSFADGGGYVAVADVVSYTCQEGTTTSYSCSYGWTNSGTQCYKAAATSYTCSTGWTKNGTTCSKAATVTYTCEEGWTVSETSCIKLPG